MKKLYVFAVTLLIITQQGLFCQNLYVSVNGSNNNPGTFDQPFRTIQYAAGKMSAGDTCFIKAGRYHETINIDGYKGSKEEPIVLMAWNGQEVWLDGTILITGKWKKYRDNIYSVKLKKPVWQLIVDGKSISSARWPNGNWNDGSIWIKEKSMSWPRKGEGGLGIHYNDELKKLKFTLEDGGIIVVNSGSFRTYKSFITSHDPGSDHFEYDTTDVKVHFSYRKRVEKYGYFLEGKKELIDVENEWFFEPQDSMLYVFFEENTLPEDHEIRGRTLSYSLTGDESHHIKLKGINFFGTTVNFTNSTYITIEDCHFKFPSYSKRMLRDLSPIEVTKLLVADEFAPAYHIIRNCIFEFMDGPALELNGKGNLVENCYFHDIDYSCTYKGGYTLNMIDASDLVFRRNTIHTTGASETFKAGRRNLIELNDISRTGYLQNDGSMVQISVKQQDQSETRYNWVHNSVKQGLRFDNSNLPGSSYGQNGTMHHNVAWKTDRVFFKGDNHYIYNNLVFDSKLNDLIISSDTAIQGWNYGTITRNNICNKFSGSRQMPGKDYPVPGIVDHNWAGNFKNADIRTQLRDPDNLDFRPKQGSEIIDAGALIEGKEIKYLGSAPDIGPYEYGCKEYRIPGFQADIAGTPVPPDGAVNVRQNADLMWLKAYKITDHDVYFGKDPEELRKATRNSPLFKGTFKNNIYNPDSLTDSETYYWRIDAVSEKGIIRGQVWKFTVE